ncbi:DUF5086 family protein [Methylomonas sp. 2BW1-5-20]|uniref:DUF5086 family protein n=1 Tax=Methylomonas sp. 2BW1-5-20 TaxID=3376686 RepID=UPI00404E6D58
MHKKLVFIFAAWLVASSACGAESRLQVNPFGTWSIASNHNEHRWVIIHNLNEAPKSGVYHIEVIGRGNGKPIWNIRHIANHMAITEEALSRSVIKPLNKGGVYPESFEWAYKSWQDTNDGKGGFICKTDVIQCLRQ